MTNNALLSLARQVWRDARELGDIETDMAHMRASAPRIESTRLLAVACRSDLPEDIKNFSENIFRGSRDQLYEEEKKAKIVRDRLREAIADLAEHAGLKKTRVIRQDFEEEAWLILEDHARTFYRKLRRKRENG